MGRVGIGSGVNRDRLQMFFIGWLAVVVKISGSRTTHDDQDVDGVQDKKHDALVYIDNLVAYYCNYANESNYVCENVSQEIRGPHY